jgi:hypothetical protein
MKAYDVALGNAVTSLIEEVERLAELGYEPQGGVAMSEAYGRLAQAMVLKKGPPKIRPLPEDEPDALP